ncbi:MAG: phasin family protein [Rhizobiaceae bacterium]
MATAKKTAGNFEYPEFDVAKFTGSFREAAEKAVAQNAEAYEQFKVAAEEATESAKQAFEAAREGAITLSSKAFENTKANTEAGITYLEKLSAIKSVSELMELQSEYFRNSFEVLSAQTKEAQELTVKVSEESAAPVKAAAEKVAAKAADVVAQKSA